MNFLNLDNWIELIKDKSLNKIFLLSNKIDNEDGAISMEEGLKYAKYYNISYHELSALKRNGFEDFKNELIETLKDFHYT